ncbi:CBS domain-containing protein [Corallococcus sp. H22C18031201]|uniref:CBS domain-containing protein n=1 Tax=Citreicoccus inhibens TaxID=2849499 RepID=UPI000E745D9A|nr:CBS domain-containing protein [Citreicoccus inhibens]MBU8897326.1 CBS domain-containing protein [Citreicoccus inhibens]RJS21367.1 CBS domain-containing protein [Corallococcus sp. H22C18031201]
MAQRTFDNGREPHSSPSTNGSGESPPARRADVAPPGSRERSESDISGWNPARDEEPSAREGRFHRAALLRMAQPRTHVDDPGAPESRVRAPGPYGTDDRDDAYATGRGPHPHQGDDLRELHRQPADYRPWDRHGYGGAPEPTHPIEPPHPAPGGPPGWSDAPEPTAWAPRDPPHAEPNPAAHRQAGRGGEARGRPHAREGIAGFLAARGHARRWRREPLTARDLMTRAVRTARRDSSLRDVAQLMKDEDCGVIPIVDAQRRLLGLVTDRDLALRAFAGGNGRPDQLRAQDVMTEDVEAVTPEEPLPAVIDLMGRRQIRRVPVVERDDTLVGILALSDIAHRADYDEELQDALERISARRSFWSRLR